MINSLKEDTQFYFSVSLCKLYHTLRDISHWGKFYKNYYFLYLFDVFIESVYQILFCFLYYIVVKKWDIYKLENVF